MKYSVPFYHSFDLEPFDETRKELIMVDPREGVTLNACEACTSNAHVRKETTS
jgi:hypothetical protein